MKRALIAAVVIALVAAPVLVLAFAPAPDAGSRTIDHKVIDGYGVSRDANLKGDACFLAVTSKEEFDRVFYPVLTPRGLPDPVAKNAFDTRLFVAVVKRGDVLYDYKVEKVIANGDTLTVQYGVAPRKGSPARGTGKAVTTARATTEKALAATGKGDTVKADAVRDTARSRDASAGFDSPLIVSVPKDKYLTVVFVENGKKVGTARVGD